MESLYTINGNTWEPGVSNTVVHFYLVYPMGFELGTIEEAIKGANIVFDKEVFEQKEWIKQGAKTPEEIKLADEEATKYASREEVAKRKEERRKLEAASTGEIWGKVKN